MDVQDARRRSPNIIDFKALSFLFWLNNHVVNIVLGPSHVFEDAGHSFCFRAAWSFPCSRSLPTLFDLRMYPDTSRAGV